MCPLVRQDVGALVEGFGTFGTSKGPVPRVNPLVLEEGPAGGEPLPSAVVPKGPLARVRPLVRGQMRALAETLVTLRATERPFS